MAEQTASMKTNIGKCLQQHSWMQERAVASPDIEDPKKIHGHKGMFTTDQRCKMDTLTTYKATHVPLMGPGVRLRGIRRELLEKHITQVIREKIHNEQSPPPPEADYSSTTQKDFCVPGFVPSRPKSTRVHDYKREQAITFWSENCQQIQGVTPIRKLNAPFRKSALFSTPISERLDEEDLPPDN
ncbi:sperm associated antigen 8 [Girardinichthys multiradiatus]|uniref:sperm associated antigen 8 n=1 Tax=Girardinichthys multiradiatus TaxID=208333 RepID=UPI001FAB7632|nr:sperm associated antigen 8 [Girardinichthys multiradiatus]